MYFFHLSWFWSNLSNKRNPKSCYFKSILSVLQNRFLTSLCNHCNASCFLPNSCSALTDRCGYQATALVAESVWDWSGWGVAAQCDAEPLSHWPQLADQWHDWTRACHSASLCLPLCDMLGRRSLCSRTDIIYTSLILLHKHQYAYAQVQLSCVYLWFQENPTGMNWQEECRCIPAEPRDSAFLQRFSEEFISSASSCGLTAHKPHDALQQGFMLMAKKWMVCCSSIKQTRTFIDTFCTNQHNNGTEWI